MGSRRYSTHVTDDGDASLSFWEAASDVLAWPNKERPLQPRQIVTRLRALTPAPRKRVTDQPAAPSVVSRVGEVAAGGRPEESFHSPSAFSEAISYLRCLREERAGVEELRSMRGYLDAAVVPATRPALIVDHASTREQLSFVALLVEPHRIESMRAGFETFRLAFASAYADHHARYWKAHAKLSTLLAGMSVAARALERLNALPALGAAVGEDALLEYRELSGARSACPATDLRAALIERPVCGQCGLTLNDNVPSEQAEDVADRLNRALVVQQRRLASEAVRRILARGGERLDQFVEIVQVADTASLPQVLDSDLLTFLEELLAQPMSPTPEALRLFEQIALAHPVITDEEVDSVAETLRTLLREELAAQREDQGAGAPSLYLKTPP